MPSFNLRCVGMAVDKDLGITYMPRMRTSIVNRDEFFYRFGEREREACASFNFLDELSTSVPSSPNYSDEEYYSKSFLTEAWSDEEVICCVKTDLKLSNVSKQSENAFDELSVYENTVLIKQSCDEWRRSSNEHLEEGDKDDNLPMFTDESPPSCGSSSLLFNALDRISLSDSSTDSLQWPDADQRVKGSRHFHHLEHNYRV